MNPRVEVVAAVIERSDGSFLLAQRPIGKVYAGYWEFPGGKIEPGESAPAALARELHEELGIDVRQSYPWLTRDFDYEHASVRLRFHRVTEWAGELHGRERQAFAWQRIDHVTAAPVLPANGPIMRALALPRIYGVSDASGMGTPAFLARLTRALERGLRLVQLREPALEVREMRELATRVREIVRGHGGRLLLNAEPALAGEARVDGVHLSARRLLETTVRPDLELVGASCHDERELTHAAKLALDFVVLGPVAPTRTHPGAAPLGWTRFAALVRDYPLPVFGIGGLGSGDLRSAWAAGAHGIAAIRAVWDDAQPLPSGGLSSSSSATGTR